MSGNGKTGRRDFVIPDPIKWHVKLGIPESTSTSISMRIEDHVTHPKMRLTIYVPKRSSRYSNPKELYKELKILSSSPFNVKEFVECCMRYCIDFREFDDLLTEIVVALCPVDGRDSLILPELTQKDFMMSMKNHATSELYKQFKVEILKLGQTFFEGVCDNANV